MASIGLLPYRRNTETQLNLPNLTMCIVTQFHPKPLAVGSPPPDLPEAPSAICFSSPMATAFSLVLFSGHKAEAEAHTGLFH